MKTLHRTFTTVVVLIAGVIGFVIGLSRFLVGYALIMGSELLTVWTK